MRKQMQLTANEEVVNTNEWKEKQNQCADTIDK